MADEPGPIFDDDLRPLLPVGTYTMLCIKTGKYKDLRYKREVVVLDFQILEGPYAGTRLQRFYALRPSVSRGSVYLREWVIANGGAVPRRRDRLPPSKFEGKLFSVRVETVTNAWDGGNYPEGLRYSRVAAILQLLTTNERAQE